MPNLKSPANRLPSTPGLPLPQSLRCPKLVKCTLFSLRDLTHPAGVRLRDVRSFSLRDLSGVIGTSGRSYLDLAAFNHGDSSTTNEAMNVPIPKSIATTL